MKLIEKKRISSNYEKEEIRLSKTTFSLKFNAINGKEGDFWIQVAPSINVSGYGNTPKEAEESFEENMNLFADDLFAVKLSERLLYLQKLGWEREKYHNKNLSKAFVDENGILQNLEFPEVKLFETVA